MEGLARKYHAIGPLLTKMEGLVAHTNTGKSPKMHHYYVYWEAKIYDALLKVYIICCYLPCCVIGCPSTAVMMLIC